MESNYSGQCSTSFLLGLAFFSSAKIRNRNSTSFCLVNFYRKYHRHSECEVVNADNVNGDIVIAMVFCLECNEILETSVCLLFKLSFSSL